MMPSRSAALCCVSSLATVFSVCPLLACSAAAPPPPTEAPATVYLLPNPPPTKRADPFDIPASEGPPRARSEWISLGRGKSLSSQLSSRARDAYAKRLLPVLFVGQRSCEPCESVKRYRTDPRMQDALAGTSILEVDLSSWSTSELSALGMYPHAIPAFYVLDQQGAYTGQLITGGAWGDDIPENMAPPLSEFFLRIRP